MNVLFNVLCGLLIFFFAINASAITCVVNVPINACWKEYYVEVEVVELSKGESIATTDLAKGGEISSTKIENCQPGRYHLRAKITYMGDKSHKDYSVSEGELPTSLDPIIKVGAKLGAAEGETRIITRAFPEGFNIKQKLPPDVPDLAKCK